LAPVADFVLKIGPPQPIAAPLLASLTILGTLLLCFRFGERCSPSTLTRVLLAAIVTFCVFALSYLAVSIDFVRERNTRAGTAKRVVLGFELKGDLEKQIKQEEQDLVTARNRDPLRNAASVNDSTDFGKGPRGEGSVPRDADQSNPFRTGQQIRDDQIEQVAARTGDPTAPYTKFSQAIVACGLFLLWAGACASLALCVGILSLASRLRSSGMPLVSYPT